MPELSDSLYLISQEMLTILRNEKDGLGIVDVWDGDQQLIPNYPAVCVETGSKQRELFATATSAQNTFTIYLMLYYSLITDDSQVIRSKAIELAEKLEHVLHTLYSNLNGRVIFGYVQEINPGYTQRKNGLTHVVRLTWQAITKTRLNDVTVGP